MNLYLTLQISAILLSLGSLLLWHSKPTKKKVVLGFLVATVLASLLLAFTTILSREGNAPHVAFWFWLCLWVLCCFSPEPLTALRQACICLLILLFGFLRFQYMSIATSNAYTDNPTARRTGIRIRHEREHKHTNVPLPKVEIRPAWHIWLTGLYTVEPAMGGRP